MIQNIKYQCPSCHGCQYRFSPFSITAKNPHGANCIFCKSQMVCLPATVSQN
ncbi:cold-shock protein [Erwinia sp. MYb375]|uniref:cold shock small protein YmcF n=1 Tax=unclassified Erwinia TaxID=2622719 RepID=UPI002D7E955C|nr:cold-shock protein [Pantoea agglomerans]